MCQKPLVQESDVFENTYVSVCATCSHNSQVLRECAVVRNKYVKTNRSKLNHKLFFSGQCQKKLVITETKEKVHYQGKM